MQTPTLAILVEREERIRKFVPRDFWEVIGTFDCRGRPVYRALVRREFSRPTKTATTSSSPSAFGMWPKREALRDKCLGKPGIVTEESKPSTSLSPLLYDLTSLQRDANTRFGFSAKNTLGLAQALYERHKVLTYPRTDSRALPEDYIGTVKNTLEMLGDEPVMRAFADADSEERLGASEQAHLQQCQSLGSLRHHPDHAVRRKV